MSKPKSTLPGQPKMAKLISLMQRAGGATETKLAKANGWLTHTTRAAICRLRQAGIAIETVRATGAETLYRVGGKARPLGPMMAESKPRKAKARKAKRARKAGAK
jgi:hypothetical protein